MKSFTLTLAIVALAMSSVTFAVAGPPQGAQLQSAPDVDLGFAVATLAAVGSFEFEVAPFYTAVIMKRHQAAVALRAGKITKAQAVAIQAQADQVRSELDSAIALCKQNPKTGKCTRGAGAAHQLLEKAATNLDKIGGAS